MENIEKSKFNVRIDFEESEEKKSMSIERGNSENELKDHLENELVNEKVSELVVETVLAATENSKPKLVRNL